MAHAVIGGLITSTLLTFVVVPVVYAYLDDFGTWAAARLKRWTGRLEQAGAVPRPAELPAER